MDTSFYCADLCFICFVVFESKRRSAIFFDIELKSGLANTEYPAVYGGLQIGIAPAMLLSSFKKDYVMPALFFYLVLSASLMVFRWVEILQYATGYDALSLAIFESFLVCFCSTLTSQRSVWNIS